MFACWQPAVRSRPARCEQIGLLAMLTDDGDEEIRATAEATLAAIPSESLAAFLGRSDVPEGLRDFFRARGVEPLPGGEVSDEPLVDVDAAAAVAEGAEAEEEDNQSIQQKLALMGVAERMKAAMKGSKSERAILIRDPNKLVSAAVLSSPKLTESEVENFAKLANVSEEVLRTIGQNRGWTKNYGVIAALTKNPKTPLAVSHAVRAAAQRSRPEDDRARSQLAGTAEAAGSQAHRRGQEKK